MTLPTLRPRDRDALIQSLRSGVTPRSGARHIQVGRNAEIATLDNLVESDRRKLASFRGKLAGFVQMHGMSMAEFQARFDAGELGDAPEWFDWDSYAALAASLENKLKDA